MQKTLIKVPDDGSRIHIESVSRYSVQITRIYPVGSELTHAEFRCGHGRFVNFMDQWASEGFIDADEFVQKMREGAAV